MSAGVSFARSFVGSFAITSGPTVDILIHIGRHDVVLCGLVCVGGVEWRNRVFVTGRYGGVMFGDVAMVVFSRNWNSRRVRPLHGNVV